MTVRDVHHAALSMTGNLAHLLARQLDGPGRILYQQHTVDGWRALDAQGNMTDWWTEADGRQFEEKAACYVDQYGGYAAVDDVKLNGKLTLGENVADNGGLRIAQAVIPSMKAQRSGSIVNISTLATRKPMPGEGGYAMAK